MSAAVQMLTLQTTNGDHNDIVLRRPRRINTSSYTIRNYVTDCMVRILRRVPTATNHHQPQPTATNRN